MRQVSLERDINIAINGPFWMEVANPEHPFTAMFISSSRGTCLIRPIFNQIIIHCSYFLRPLSIRPSSAPSQKSNKTTIEIFFFDTLSDTVTLRWRRHVGICIAVNAAAQAECPKAAGATRRRRRRRRRR